MPVFCSAQPHRPISELKAELEQLRASWEKIGNRHLERHGFAPTLDRRTLAEQGKERAATLHLGKNAMALERRGVATDLGDYNRAAQDERERERDQQREGRKTGDSNGPRVTVATTDAGLVAQEREAMRALRRAERMREITRTQDEAARQRDHDPDRTRKRGR